MCRMVQNPKSPQGYYLRMGQAKLRVTKWLSSTPAAAVCDSCNREFKVPMTQLSKTKDAHASLEEQFDRHKCQTMIAS